mmetsp:Transcript_3438/g.7453  ORF Transcript_3438/g.7453 Transcript_3438/m.7453 type:complete len:229 (-) Transcript_3438:111-797(-)
MRPAQRILSESRAMSTSKTFTAVKSSHPDNADLASEDDQTSRPTAAALLTILPRSASNPFRSRGDLDTSSCVSTQSSASRTNGDRNLLPGPLRPRALPAAPRGRRERSLTSTPEARTDPPPEILRPGKARRSKSMEAPPTSPRRRRGRRDAGITLFPAPFSPSPSLVDGKLDSTLRLRVCSAWRLIRSVRAPSTMRPGFWTQPHWLLPLPPPLRSSASSSPSMPSHSP